MYFRQVIGQTAVKEQLIARITANRIPHAQLIVGGEGTGTLPLALAFARYVLCQDRQPTDSCGKCPACKKMDSLMHADLHFVYPVIKKATSDVYRREWCQMLTTQHYFGLTQWLEAIGTENQQAIIYERESAELLHKLRLKSTEGGYKVIIIWLPEKMNVACANKILKLLEEPPAMTLFLLVAQQPEQMLTTILSRTQRIQVPPLAEQEIALALHNDYGLTPQDAADIAHLCGGNFVQALQEIQTAQENRVHLELFIEIMRASYQKKIRDMRTWSEKVAALGREEQLRFLTYTLRMVRENFIHNLHTPQLTYMNSGEKGFATRFAPFVNERNVGGMVYELNEALDHISNNVNARMVFFDFSLKLTVLLKQ